LADAPEIHKVTHNTNAIGSLSRSLRKVTWNRQAFPTSEAAMKLVYIASQNISMKWVMPIQDWR
jgi:transposase-like protein